MRTNELFKNKTVLSFEVFPPKRDAPIDTIYKTLAELGNLSPDFISVTCGAGGDGGNTTVQIASDIKNMYGRESVAHLPCINLTKADVLHTLAQLKENGIENILALRGDYNPSVAPKTDFKYAADIVAFIKEHGDFNIIGACYPEGHSEAASLAVDVKNLKTKVDAGVSQLVSQLFFDNQYFYSFLERAEISDIDVPIQAGIMPVTNKKQIERILELCGAALPEKFKKIMDKYENNPSALRDAGIAYAIDQIVDLITHDVDGIHLYTMNNPGLARRITDSVSSLFKVNK